MSAWPLVWQLRQELLAVRRGLLVIFPAEAVHVQQVGGNKKQPASRRGEFDFLLD
jgi:hypothetical protein